MIGNFPLPLASLLPAMSREAIGRVQHVERLSRDRPQVKIPVHHILHGGMYVRTVKIPAGVMITGCLVKVATVLVVAGHCVVHNGTAPQELNGYHVLRAEAGRKQIFVARADTMLTMCFPTDAKTVKEAEERFTDETNLLQSREV